MNRPDGAPLATYLLGATGMLALLPAEGEGRALLLVAAGALLLWAGVERRTAARIPGNVARAADLLTATLVVGLAAMRFALNQASLTSIGHVLAAAQLARAFRRKTARDVMVMNGTAVAQVTIAAFLTKDLLYLPVLGAAVLLGVVASLGLPTEGAGAREARLFVGRPVGRAGTRSRLGVVLQPAIFTVAILAIGAAVFVLLPRGAPFRRAPEAAAAPRFDPVDPAPTEFRPAPRRGAVTGFTESVRLGEIGDVKSYPREAFTVQLSDGRRPLRFADRLLYFRGAVLDDFDGRGWRRDPAIRPDRWLTTSTGTGMVGIHPELAERRPGTFRILQQYRMRASAFRALPVLGSVVGIDLSEDLPRIRDLGAETYASPAPHEDGFTFSLTSLVAQDPMRPVLPATLTEEERRVLTRLHPGALRIAELAREVAGNGDSLSRIRRLTEWLGKNCSYTLRFKDRPPARPLEHFLFETRAGHCEYFASALAMMLRAADVPTRLATGFRGGLWIESSESYFVRMSDAHAWVLAFVPDRGWVRVDPTPPDADSVNVPESRVPGAEDEAGEEWFGPRLGSLVREFGPAERERLMGGMRSALDTFLREGVGIGRPPRRYPPPVPLAFFAAAVAFAAVWFLGRARRRRRRLPELAAPGRRTPPPPPAAFYEEALRILARAGERRGGAESPREFLVRMETARGPRAHAFRPITLAFEDARYGLVPTPEQEARRLGELVERLRFDLAALSPIPGTGREAGAGD